MTLKDTQLGRYIMQRKLGEGNYAEVWLAQDAFLERPVALKLLKPMWMADEDTRVRFLREARVLANLHHPRIAWVWDLGEEQGRAFIAMRYVDGVSLDQLIRQKGRLEWEEALRIVAEAAEGLEFAHRKGLVHRDIKPQNILVSAEDGVVLTDFGLVRALEGSGAATRTSVMLGTPAYMAPEIWSGQPASPATDQYALACTLVEMLTGSPLFEAPTTPAIMMKHFQPVNFPVLPENLPAGKSDTIQKALLKDPVERYAGLSQWISALKETIKTPEVKPPVPQAIVAPPKAVEPVIYANEIRLELAPGIEMIFMQIPAGDFLYTEENITIYLSKFWIGKYPVTNSQFQAFLMSSAYTFDHKFFKGKENYPVVNVSWRDASAFCDWAAQISGKPIHLPTEAQWEKAARGIDGSIYPWGEAEPDENLCNFSEIFRGTSSVGLFSPLGDSPYGCADMVGNVLEWCADWYAYLPEGIIANPTGPKTGKEKILRGGSWFDGMSDIGTTIRFGDKPEKSDDDYGFRCALNWKK